MNAAIKCLEAKFEWNISRHGNAIRAGFVPDGRWHGPSALRPMIELLSVMDAGQPMRIIPSDYDHPGQVCL